jgi:hypothetical protein
MRRSSTPCFARRIPSNGRAPSEAGRAQFRDQEPLGFAAGDTNFYRYEGNDPTNATDSSGLQAVPTIDSSRLTESTSILRGRLIPPEVGYEFKTPVK